MLTLLATLLLQLPPAATPPAPVQSIKRLGEGTLVTLWARQAPFPAKNAPYTDSTVLVWVPDSYRSPSSRTKGRSSEVNIVLHFHGHSMTAEHALRWTHLHEQLARSRRQAILVVPQLAFEARDSRAGKLETPGGVRRLLYDVLGLMASRPVARKLGASRLPRRPRPGQVVVSAHSGGFQAAGYAVLRGQIDIREVYLFDALYGFHHHFVKWLAGDKRRRLVHIHRGTGKVARWTPKLLTRVKRRNIPVVTDIPEGSVSSAALSSARLVVSQTAVPHDRVPFENNALRDCLRGSDLPGPPDSFRTDRRAPRLKTPQLKISK